MDTSGVVDCCACCAGCAKGLLLAVGAAAKGLGLLLAPPSAPKGLAEGAVLPEANGFGFAPSCEG